MTVRHQFILDVQIDCVIKTVLSWLRNVFRFVSITECLAILALPTIGDVGEVNVEKSGTDNVQQVSIDRTQVVRLERNTEGKILPLTLAGLLWGFRTERSWGTSEGRQEIKRASQFLPNTQRGQSSTS